MHLQSRRFLLCSQFLLWTYPSNYGSIDIISETTRDIGRKSSFFIPSLAFDVPVRGYPSEYCHPAWYEKQEALLSQWGRVMLRVCIASIQNVERSLLLLVVSASDIPLRTIKFFYVVFSSAYWSMLQAVTNIRWCVADCAIYTAWSSVTVFVTS